MIFFVVCRYFSNFNFFQKMISGTLSESQTVWTLIRSNVFVGPDLSPVIQTTEVAASKERLSPMIWT